MTVGHGVGSAPPGSTGADSELEEPDIGWPRAVASGLAILVVGFLVAVDGVNSVVTKLTGVGRTSRQYLGSGLFLVVIVAIAWGLRRLQARRLI